MYILNVFNIKKNVFHINFNFYRAIIKRCVNAGKDDVVIFTGSGATAGINKIAWGLCLNDLKTALDTVTVYSRKHNIFFVSFFPRHFFFFSD